MQEPYGVEALRDVDPAKALAMTACLTILGTDTGSGDGDGGSTVDDEFRLAQGDFGLEQTGEDVFDIAA